MEDYRLKRENIIKKEKQCALGGDIILTEKERLVHEKILKIKYKELNEDGKQRPWSQHFLNIVSDIKKSEIFKLIKKIPKGGSLHSHLFASASFDFVSNNLLRRDNLYVCNSDGKQKLRFLSRNTEQKECVLLAHKQNDKLFNDSINSQLVLNKTDTDVWNSFKKIFTFTYDMLSHVDVLEDYVFEVLMEHYSDNIIYIEVRTPFVLVYDLKGTTYQAHDFVDIVWKTVQKFKQSHSDFVGMKLIYAQYRKIDTDTLRDNFNTLKSIIQKYPNFIAGIDFVGYEEDGTLLDYIEELKELHEVNFYFHAGETALQGTSVDFNVLDAILLGSKRIGHAYALSKHPEMLKMVKEKDIALEICPISNQVLELVTDLRNHPAAYYIAHGFPVVICNDDPGYWHATGLSYDWYMAFMAMSSQNSGIELLKKLAMNSLTYGALNNEEKQSAFKIWNRQWEQFLQDVI